MEFYEIFLVCIAVSIDGMVTGLAYGAGKIAVPLRSLLLIALIPIIMCFCAMSLVNIFSYLLNSWFIKLVSAALMFILVVLSARQYILSLSINTPNKPTLQNILVEPLLADTDNCKDITPIEAVLVGIAVGMDASAASIVLAFAGASIILIPIAMGATHFILVGIGNLCGRYGFKNCSQQLRLIPVILFSILFISRVFLLL